MGRINPVKFLQLKTEWDRFRKRHPKLEPFMNAASQDAMKEGTILEVCVTTTDQRKLTSNLKLTEEDVRFMEQVKELLNSKTVTD